MTAHSLLLAFGYLISHIDLFGKYDFNQTACPTSLIQIDELNTLAQQFLNQNLPSLTLSCNSILSLYKGLITEIRDAYTSLNYTARLITKVHDTDPSLDPEDL